MFEDEDNDASRTEKALTPKARASEKAEELRMYAQLYAIYEGGRKFDAIVNPDLPGDAARDVQRTIAKLAKSRDAAHPILPANMVDEAARLLTLGDSLDLSTNDYHVEQRSGELIVVRWLAGEQIDSFYDRLQAHFDAGLRGAIDDERNNAWKQDDAGATYLEELEKLENEQMGAFYLRPLLTKPGVFCLSTLSADAINIEFLADHVMSVGIEALAGEENIPPDSPSEDDLSWYYKLFALRGSVSANDSRMLFFTYLQKTSEDW